MIRIIVSPTAIENQIKLMRRIPMAQRILKHPSDNHEEHMNEIRALIKHTHTINYLRALYKSLTGLTHN